MKKNVLFLILIVFSFCLMAQEKRGGDGTPFATPKYANDVIIYNDAGIDQRNVKISVAFNGWLYAAFSQVDQANNKGGIVITRSKDNGETWQLLDSYFPLNNKYPAHDIVVAGSDTNNLTLYLVAVNENSFNEYTLFVDRYNATTGAFIGSNLNINKGSRPIMDVAIASDYRFPAVDANPYSVAIAYSVFSTSIDSVNYVCSLDGGNSFTVFSNVAKTGDYFRKISLAYGKSASASNGRYFLAWEQLSTGLSRVGHIYTSRNQYNINGNWITPENLDSISTGTINTCRNPVISVQHKLSDNDSGSCTAVVMVDRDFYGDGSDYDVLGFYNNRSHFTNYWFRFDIINTTEYDMHPHVSYDPDNDNFLAVYYDSTNAKLNYLVNNGNMATPNSWMVIKSQYNDQNNLKAAFPRVAINPVEHQVAHVWTAEGAGNKGIAMFDAEYSTIGISDNETFSGNLFPNPASDKANLIINGQHTENCVINIYDINGKRLSAPITKVLKAGGIHAIIDVTEMINGMYYIIIQSGNKSQSYKLIVSHP